MSSTPGGLGHARVRAAYLAAAVVNQATVEQLAAEAAARIAELRAAGFHPAAVGVRSGSLHGLTTVAALPVVRLAADSDVPWGVIV